MRAGSTSITESLAQYSSLMLAKQRYDAQAVCPLLRRLRNGYLQGRHRAGTPESPLADVGDIAQGYIYYDKGALAFYALQDYLGEDRVNGVSRQFLADARFKGPWYPTADQFLALLDTAAGPPWQCWWMTCSAGSPCSTTAWFWPPRRGCRMVATG